MDKKFLGQLIGEIDHLMERTKWQSKIAEREMEASAKRIDICRRGAGALLLLCELFGEKAQEVPEYKGLREIVQTVDSVVAELPPQARAIVAERYGLGAALTDVGIDGDGKFHHGDVLQMLRHPKRSRRLRTLVGPKGRG